MEDIMETKINQEIIDLYDEYTHAPLSRRDFLDKLTKMVGGSAAALAMLPFLQNNYAQAAIVDPTDNSIETSFESYKLFDKEIKYYMAKPKGDIPLPTVLIIHENRGLNPHIQDIVRRLAKEGFLAFAPDALSLVGGTPDDEDKAREMFKTLDTVDTMDLYRSSVVNMSKKSICDGNIGAVGFCWGGGWANRLAVHCSKLSCSVSYYGKQLNAKESAKVRVPLMLHYAGLDKRIGEGIKDYIGELSQNDKEFTMHNYSGVNHAFNNDTNAARYNKEAAELSWIRTTGFLKMHLMK
jgi:carboxymethylenebutenolidase